MGEHPELRRLVQDEQMLDGLSLTAILYALAFGELTEGQAQIRRPDCVSRARSSREED